MVEIENNPGALLQGRGFRRREGGKVIIFKSISRHATIVTSLMLREVITRYGRRGLGFLWLIGEPLLFTGAVILLWSFIKAPISTAFGSRPLS